MHTITIYRVPGTMQGWYATSSKIGQTFPVGEPWSDPKAIQKELSELNPMAVVKLDMIPREPLKDWTIVAERQSGK